MDAVGRRLGTLHTWWHGDALPAVAPPDGFLVDESDQHEVLARMAQLPIAEVLARIERNNRPYVAKIGDESVAYGWSAAGPAEIDTILRFDVPEGERYLWDFVTLPGWRRLGIYPALLQEIVRREATAVSRFWVGHDAGNEPSRRGILKAGFREAGEMRMLPDSRLVFMPGDDADRSQAGAVVLGLPLLRHDPPVGARCA
ncbi:MAG: GNAT family N-acetyltransferase [Chloroflexia bacterium]|nr:GNAT family N-acetyltransferase [Chloroflexia bacterium]